MPSAPPAVPQTFEVTAQLEAQRLYPIYIALPGDALSQQDYYVKAAMFTQSLQHLADMSDDE